MYVLFLFCLYTAFTSASENSEQRVENTTSKFKGMKTELESLRFTMYLWSCFNVGLLLVLVYSSWRAYKRQEKMTEWRV